MLKRLARTCYRRRWRVLAAWIVFLVAIGFVLMFLRAVQVALANWRRGYSILERPEAFDPVLAD